MTRPLPLVTLIAMVNMAVAYNIHALAEEAHRLICGVYPNALSVPGFNTTDPVARPIEPLDHVIMRHMVVKLGDWECARYTWLVSAHLPVIFYHLGQLSLPELMATHSNHGCTWTLSEVDIQGCVAGSRFVQHEYMLLSHFILHNVHCLHGGACMLLHAVPSLWACNCPGHPRHSPLPSQALRVLRRGAYLRHLLQIPAR